MSGIDRPHIPPHMGLSRPGVTYFLEGHRGFWPFIIAFWTLLAVNAAVAFGGLWRTTSVSPRASLPGKTVVILDGNEFCDVYMEGDTAAPEFLRMELSVIAEQSGRAQVLTRSKGMDYYNSEGSMGVKRYEFFPTDAGAYVVEGRYPSDRPGPGGSAVFVSRTAAVEWTVVVLVTLDCLFLVVALVWIGRHGVGGS